jgi:hypothetical protein
MILANGREESWPELRVAESRRSTRVPLKVVIAAQGINEQLTCDGETIIVNRHGALISCTAPLRVEMKIEILPPRDLQTRSREGSLRRA